MARTLSEEAHRKVLQAAQGLLLEQGMEACTVDAVAQRSGVAKSTIYRHFANSHEMLIAALDGIIEPLPTPNTGSLRADLLQLFTDRLHLAADPNLRLVVLNLLSATASDPELARIHDALKEQRAQPVRTVVELAIGRGELSRSVDPDLATDLIEGPLFLHVFVRQLPLTVDKLHRIVDVALAGLFAWPDAPTDDVSTVAVSTDDAVTHAGAGAGPGR